MALVGRDLDKDQVVKLEEIRTSCQSLLIDLERILTKYIELSPPPNGPIKKTRRLWKRLKWEPNDVRELRSRITSNVSLLNAFNGQTTRNQVAKLLQIHDDQQHQTILHWICPHDYSRQQSDFISRRQPGTGQWMLESPEFREWQGASGNHTLFCFGIPGAGKTIMAATVIDELQRQVQPEAGAGIAYIYFNFRQAEDQDPSRLLSILLRQLVQQQATVSFDVKAFWERHKSSLTRPSFDELSSVLHSVAASFSQLFLIVDALDECQEANGYRAKFLDSLLELQTKCPAKLLATSRSFVDMMQDFEGSKLMEIRAKSEDVSVYVESQLYRLPKFVNRNAELQGMIRSAIGGAVEGM